MPREVDNRNEHCSTLFIHQTGRLQSKNLQHNRFGVGSRSTVISISSSDYSKSILQYYPLPCFLPAHQEGKLFPQQNFADQSHFIKEVKKLAGVSPKELLKNQNERFIQFSTLRST
ncbi:hypothetical protein [Sphingobacterium multivorum]|uniref:hypothetical protein n=1 Tax=Sphingobacterium multivorum TaxID=28454 RepID=UPI0021154FE6|nr:hypothetical protein [Sphingobacterium multivorum]